jgi:dihydrodipicolinate synthase/N-acetylneuraminate lyase
MKVEGIHIPAITRLGADGEIDRRAFADVLESLIAAGTVKSTLAGMMAADLATGTRFEDLEWYMRRSRAGSRPEPFARLGATAVIRWQEVRAGQEG